MSDSLDQFIRRAFDEHDDGDPAVVPTIADAGAGVAKGLGTLPGHVVEGFIARGGMGAIYRAKQGALEREVAVKVMTREAASPEMAERFRREALVLGRLAHPNIVPIYDIGTDEEGQLYYTMKLVKGRTLQHILSDLGKGEEGAARQHSLVSLLTIFRKICDALAFAHSQGVLHRDLKPENVMVGEFGEVMVMDWGLAKIQKEEKRVRNGGEEPNPPLPPLSPGHLDCPSQTRAGSVVGTPQYMSPEQARGEVDELDARSDIFALGGILYAILTLRPPVEGKTLEEVLEKVRTGRIAHPTAYGATVTSPKGKAKVKAAAPDARKILPLPHTPGGRVPGALSSVAMKALRLEKVDRYQDVAALSADIEAYQGGFATIAERAGALKQLKLLMLRHKAVTASLAAMVLLSAGFVIKVMASERKATRNAEIAVEKAEEARRSLAQTRIALADADATNLDAAAMRRELDACPPDLRDDSWRYLDGKVDSAVATADASIGPVYRSVFRRTGSGPAADGEFLMSAEAAPYVYAVRPDTGEVTRRMHVGIDRRKEIGLSPDGTEFAVASGVSLKCLIFDAETGEERFRLEEPDKGDITHVSLSADRARLILLWKSAGMNELRCVDRATRAIVWRIDVQSAHESRDGRLIACSSANTVHVVRADTGELVSTMEPSRAFLWDIAFNHDSTLVAAADHFGFVTVSEVATGRRKQSFRVTNGRVTGVAFTDGGQLVTLGQTTADLTSQRVIQLWNLEHVVAVDTQFGAPAKGYGLAFDPAGGWTCAQGPETKFWHLPIDGQLTRIDTGNANTFVFFLGGDHLVTSHGPSYLNFWDLRSTPPKALPPLPAHCNTGAVNKTGKHAIFSNINPKNAFAATLSEAGSPLVRREPWKLIGQASALNEAGDEALCGNGPEITHFVKGRAQPLHHLALEGVKPWKRVAFADGGKKIVGIGSGNRKSGAEEDVVAFWDHETGALLHRIDHPAVLTSISVSPDGREVAYAGTDKTVFIVTADDFRFVHRFRAHDKAITAIAWHPSRPILATVSDDVSLKLWNTEDGTLLARTLGIGRSILSVGFSPTGDRVAIGTADERALIYDTMSLLSSHPRTTSSRK
jgi:serine/threonine protein kinase/WD40 repeat protein